MESPTSHRIKMASWDESSSDEENLEDNIDGEFELSSQPSSGENQDNSPPLPEPDANLEIKTEDHDDHAAEPENVEVKEESPNGKAIESEIQNEIPMISEEGVGEEEEDDANNPVEVETGSDVFQSAICESEVQQESDVPNEEETQSQPKVLPEQRCFPPIATTHEETWDFSLLTKTKTPDCNKSGTICLQDEEFQRKLGIFSAFDSCEHEAIKIQCPCENKVLFSICAKCHRVFCNNKCLKKTKDKNVRNNTDGQGILPKSNSNSTAAASSSSSSRPSHHSRSSLTSTNGSVYSGLHPGVSTPAAKRTSPGRQQHNQMQRKGENRPTYNPGLMTSPPLVNAPHSPQPNLPQGIVMSQDLFRGQGLMGGWPSEGPVPGPPAIQHQPQTRHGLGATPMRQSFITQSFPSFRPNAPQTVDRVPIYRNSNYPATVPPLPSYNNNNIPTLYPSSRPRVPMPSSFIRGTRPSLSDDAGRAIFALLNLNTDSTNTNGTNTQSAPELIGNPSKPANAASSHLNTDPYGPTASPYLPGYSPTKKDPMADVSQLQKFRGVGRGGQANIGSSPPSTSYATGVGNSSNSSGQSSRPTVPSENIKRPLNPYAPDAAKNEFVTTGAYSPLDFARVHSKPRSSIFPEYNQHNSSKPDTAGNTNKWNKYPMGQLRRTEPAGSTSPPKSANISNKSMTPISKESWTASKPPFQSASIPSHSKTKAGSGQTTPLNVSSEFRCEPYIFYGVPMQVIHSHGDSFFDFYVSSGIGCYSNDSIFEELLTVDQNPSMTDTVSKMTLVVGEYCIAKYSNAEDGSDACWYRAIITGVEGNLFTVLFFDYGNTTVVTRALIRPLPTSVKQMRPSAIRITIGDFEPTVPSEELRPVFENYIRQHKFRIRVIIFENPGNTSDSNYSRLYKARVEIKHDDRWIGLAAVLENDGYGRTISFSTHVHKHVETKCDDYPSYGLNDFQQEIGVRISHFNHPNDFYVIRENHIKDREDVMRKLNPTNAKYDEYSMKEWESTNYVCIAQRSDKKWARAIITEITEEADVRIRFFDFGETIAIPLIDLKLKRIPRELLSVPQLAFRCSLPVFPAEEKWDLTDPYVTIFQEMKNMNIPVVIVMFALEFLIDAYIVEVFQGDKVGGLSKTLLKKRKDMCGEGYEVDLDIRKKIGSPQLKQSEKDVPLRHTQPPAPSTGTHDFQPKLHAEASLHRPLNNMSGSDVLSHAPAKQETQFFHLEDLEPSKPLQFYSKSEFKIIYFQGFNELFIQPSDFMDLEMRLQDQIIECIDSDNSVSGTEATLLNSIVIAPYTDGNFYRAVIKKISNRKARVEFIDNGKSLRIPLQRLTPASVGVLKFPKLVYRVKLLDVDDDPELLLLDDCIEVMEKMFRMTHLMEMCNGAQEPYVVNLRPLGAPLADTVSKRILTKQVWEWESLFNSGCKTDTALLSKSKFRSDCPPKSSLINPRILPLGVKFNGEVSRFIAEGDLCIVDIQDSLVRRDHVVLENQIARFVEKVTSTSFFPTIDEIMLIYLPDIPQFRELNLHGTGKWNRCLRESADYFRNIDYDELYPMQCSDQFEFRRLSPEFLFRVPAGMVECSLKDYKPSTSLNERMQLELGNRKRIRFAVDNYDKENEIQVITVDNLPM